MPTIEIVSIGTHWPSGGFVYTSYAVYWQIYLAILGFKTRLHAPMIRNLLLLDCMGATHSQLCGTFLNDDKTHTSRVH